MTNNERGINFSFCNLNLFTLGLIFVCSGLILWSVAVKAACIPITNSSGSISPVIAGTGGLSVGNNSYITGSSGTTNTSGTGTSMTTTAGVSTPGQTLPAFSPATFPTVGGANKTINNSTLAAGSYGDVTVSGNSSFSGGNYYISKLTVDNGVTLNLAGGNYFVDTWAAGNNFVLNVSSGVVKIYIKTSFSVGNESAFNAAGSTVNLQIYAYNYAQLQFGNANNGNSNVDFNGLLYAPGSNTKIEFGNNNVIQGAVLSGGTIDLGNNTGIIFDAATQAAIGSISPDGTGCTPTVSTHHYELSLPSTSINCVTTPVTLKACANNSSPCTSFDTSVNGKTATLASSAGALAATTIIFNSSGVATTTLSYPSAINGASATITLSAVQSAASNASQCCADGISCTVSNSCVTIFSSAGFIFANAINGAVTTLPSQISAVTSPTYYLRAVKTNTTTKVCEAALTGAQSVNFAYECNNPTSCATSNLLNINATTIARNNNGGVSSFLPVNLTFDGNGNTPFSFVYDDVGMLKLYANKTVSGSFLSGSSNAFVVKPHHFSISNIKQTAAPQLANPAAANATDAKFVKAGEAFTATITALNANNVATPNFGKETTAEGVILARNLILPVGGATGTLSNGSIAGSSFSSGVATVTNLAWNEVGIITLTPSIADADYLGAGDVSGTTTGNIGRFYPDHFALTQGTATPYCNVFTYFGQDGFSSTGFILTAQNLANATTQNYTGNFAKLGLTWDDFVFTTATSLPTGSILSASVTTPTGSWTNGVATITAKHQISRPTGLTGETAVTIKAKPVDSDGVTLASAMDVTASTPLRYGRVFLQNAYGSELLDLAIPMTAQYWNGSGWITNTADSCTDITLNFSAIGTDITNKVCVIESANSSGRGCAAVPTISNHQFLETGLTGLDSNNISGFAGNFNLWLKTTAVGSLKITATVPSYLQNAGSINPNARATFGIYKGNTKQIYFRELY
jgi:hypothetical protein